MVPSWIIPATFYGFMIIWIMIIIMIIIIKIMIIITIIIIIIVIVMYSNNKFDETGSCI